MGSGGPMQTQYATAGGVLLHTSVHYVPNKEGLIMARKRVVVVGAGPGGLTAGMILARRGCDVTLFEKDDRVGGRNRTLEIDGFVFDVGPTFLMMKYILDEVFELAGKKIDDYLDVAPLDPMYVLNFGEDRIEITTDHERLKQQIARLFPGEEQGLDAFMRAERVRYEKMIPCLKKDYSSFSAMYAKDMRNALPHLSIGKSLFANLGRYFASERLRVCFTFQAKYLGMSPWQCPAAFTIIPYIEHAFGIHHVRGGLSRISEAMARVLQENGGTIRTETPVKRVLVRAGRAVGVELDTGERIDADEVVINADFGHAMSTLFEPGVLRKYTPARLQRMKYSCSTFMLYLGLDKVYPEPHHQILFAADYRKNIEDIAVHGRVSEDLSVYVRNASVSDPTLAPAGKSALYVLVPVPNNTHRVDWTAIKDTVRSRVFNTIKSRTSMTDIEQHIEVERMITPLDWANEGVHYGATFNLAHTLGQMLYFRPRNRFEEVSHCYLVGGGTHPGSGLPTIYESGRISADLITGT